MANGTFPLELPRLTDQRTTCAFISAVFAVVAFGVIFWGYPLEAMNFSDFHFYEREQPVLWGLSIVEPETGRINYAFLFHNEGLMTLLYFLLNRLPLDIPDKQVFVNSFSIALQVLNAVLFTAVLWRLVGLSRLFPYLLLFLLYPFAAANHYWQSCIPNNLAAAFFLGSLLLYLHIDYDPDNRPAHSAESCPALVLDHYGGIGSLSVAVVRLSCSLLRQQPHRRASVQTVDHAVLSARLSLSLHQHPARVHFRRAPVDRCLLWPPIQ